VKECFRSIEESAAYVARGHVQILDAITRRRTKEIVFCGGASKGVLWPQILADVLGVRVKIPVVRESTALGAAICAGFGVDLFSNLQAGKRLVKWDRVIEPDLAIHRKYLKLYDRWIEVYSRMVQLVEDNLVEPMWRAAGT
jgi:autoinducer 2 (AI-2) kinase